MIRGDVEGYIKFCNKNARACDYQSYMFAWLLAVMKDNGLKLNKKESKDD